MKAILSRVCDCMSFPLGTRKRNEQKMAKNTVVK